MTIDWKQVLEIETSLKKIVEQNDLMFIWRWQTVKSSLRVDKEKKHSFADVCGYLDEKYSNDNLLEDYIEVILDLFNAVASGEKICEMDSYLLADHQTLFDIDENDINYNILNQCTRFTGASALYLNVLKFILDSKGGEIKPLNQINQINQKIVIDLFRNFDIENSIFCKEYNLLKDSIISYLNGVDFKSFVYSYNKNNYDVPYNIHNPTFFLENVLSFAKSKVIEMICDDSTNYFSYRLELNESPYAEDLRNSTDGIISIYTTLNGFLNYDKIIELKLNGNLVSYIKNILDEYFETLSFNSFTDSRPGSFTSGDRYNSSMILGDNLIFKDLFNNFINHYERKLLSGTIWFHDDVNGFPYSYLNFHNKSDYFGQYNHSIPFTNVISNYHIAYLDKVLIDRDLEDFKIRGYSLE